MRTIIVASLLLILSCPNAEAQTGEHPTETLALSLVETLTRSLDVSPEIAAVAADVDFSTARLKQAKASRFLAEFTATTGHAPVPGLSNPNNTPDDQLYLDPDVRNEYDKLRIFNQIEFELLQPVYTWGALSQNIKAANRGVQVDQAKVDQKTSEIALRTAELYYSLALADGLNRLVGETGRIVDRAKTEIDRLLQEGRDDVDDADLFQVLITEQEFNKRVVEVREKLLTARVALKRQLLLPDNVVIATAENTLEALPFRKDSLSTYLASGLAMRPEMAQAQSGLDAWSALVQVAKSDYFPQLFLGAKYRVRAAPGRIRQPNPFHSDSYTGQSLEAGVGIRQRLNFHITKSKVEQAAAERNKVAHQLEAAGQLVQFEVEEAYRNLTIAEASLQSRNEALRISKEWLQTESINFDLDLGDTENLVKAVQVNLELRASALEAIFAYNRAVLRLLHASGQLVPQLRNGILVVN